MLRNKSNNIAQMLSQLQKCHSPHAETAKWYSTYAEDEQNNIA
jgi:hypothetical protein